MNLNTFNWAPRNQEVEKHVEEFQRDTAKIIGKNK